MAILGLRALLATARTVYDQNPSKALPVLMTSPGARFKVVLVIVAGASNFIRHLPLCIRANQGLLYPIRYSFHKFCRNRGRWLLPILILICAISLCTCLCIFVWKLSDLDVGILYLKNARHTNSIAVVVLQAIEGVINTAKNTICHYAPLISAIIESRCDDVISSFRYIIRILQISF